MAALFPFRRRPFINRTLAARNIDWPAIVHPTVTLTNKSGNVNKQHLY